MSLDGLVYIVRLLEIDLKRVTFDQDLNIVWPGSTKRSTAPRIDGVLLLHDATHPEKLERTIELAGMNDSSNERRVDMVDFATDRCSATRPCLAALSDCDPCAHFSPWPND